MKKLILLFLILSLTGCNNASLGAGKIDYKKDKHLKLKEGKIIGDMELDDIRCDDDGACEKKGKITRYMYVSDKKIDRKDKDFNGKKYTEYKRIGHAVFYEPKKELKTKNDKVMLGAAEDETEYITEFHSSTQFYELDDEWFQTEVATTTTEAYEDQTATSTAESIIDIFFNIASAACGDSGGDCFAGAGDGATLNNNSGTWSTIRNSATSKSANYTGTTLETVVKYVNATKWPLSRAFYPFDTSALPDGATVTATDLKLYGTTLVDTNNQSLVFVETTQASPTTLVVADYDNCGSVDTPTEIANRLDLTSFSTSAYNTIALTDLTVVSLTSYTQLGTRISSDVDNDVSAYTVGGEQDRILVSSSEETGTSQDPILVVTYTEAGGGFTQPPFTSTTIID